MQAITIQGNYIGTDKTGTAALANAGDGITVFDSFSDTIGGTAAGAGNIISANVGEGVHISGPYATGTSLQGNQIGTNVTGTAALANRYGVVIDSGAADNTIGGTVAGAGNVISGNAGDGVEITGSGTTGNLVAGNLIGTNAAGTAALANPYGVVIHAGASGNTIGGLTTTPGTGAGNLISGNTNYGVYVTGASGNLVEGNLIGTDLAGSAALGNVNGVILIGSSSDTIGGTAAGARNVISGNRSVNVYLDGVSDETVQGNYVGTDVTGSFALSTITQIGIGIDGSDNLIGGSIASAGNVISGNADYGVAVGVGGMTISSRET